MPAAQVIDLNPEYKKNPVQENLETFFTKLGKDYRDKQDRVEIGKIISQYDQSKREVNDYQNALSALDNSTISPTKRLELANSFKSRQEASLENMKALNTQTALMQQQTKKEAADKAKLDKEKKAEQDVIAKAEKTSAEVEELAKLAGKSPEEAKKLAKTLSVESARALVSQEASREKVKAKEDIKKEEANREMSLAQDSFNNLVDLTEDAGWATKFQQYVPGEGGRKAARTVGEFTSTLGSLEGILKDRVSRGTLSNARFKYITEQLLPKVDDLQDVIIGKLKGLGKTLDFDTTELDKRYPDIGAVKSKEETAKKAPEGMIRVRLKSDPTKTGSVTPYPGWEKKYDPE